MKITSAEAESQRTGFLSPLIESALLKVNPMPRQVNFFFIDFPFLYPLNGKSLLRTEPTENLKSGRYLFHFGEFQAQYPIFHIFAGLNSSLTMH